MFATGSSPLLQRTLQMHHKSHFKAILLGTESPVRLCGMTLTYQNTHCHASR